MGPKSTNSVPVRRMCEDIDIHTEEDGHVTISRDCTLKNTTGCHHLQKLRKVQQGASLQEHGSVGPLILVSWPPKLKKAMFLLKPPSFLPASLDAFPATIFSLS